MSKQNGDESAFGVAAGWEELLSVALVWFREYKPGHPARVHGRATLEMLWDGSTLLQQRYRRDEQWSFSTTDVDQAVGLILLRHIDNLTRAMGQMEGRHQHGGDVGSTPSGSPNIPDEPTRASAGSTQSK